MIKRFLFCVPLVSLLFIAACNIDAVIASLNTAAAVADSAAGIVRSQDADAANVLQGIAKGLGDVVVVYQDYEKAAPGEKPGKLALLQSAVTAVQSHLPALLEDVRVKNPGLVRYVTVAVAVVNSALSIVMAKSFQSFPSTAAVARATIFTGNLPIVPGARSARDLAKAWNDTVKAEHPEAVIR